MSTEVSDLQFRRMFDANHDAIRAYCLRRLPPDDAADAASEIFLVAWRRVDSLPDDTDERPWLPGVARNVVRNSSRSTRRRSVLGVRLGGLGSAPGPDPQSELVVADEHDEIMAAFRHLGRGDQEILRLRLWEELTVGEVAIVLECSEKAASKRYQRALKRLANEAEKPAKALRMRPHPMPKGGETCAT